MAIKTFCDACAIEIPLAQDTSFFKFIKWKMGADAGMIPELFQEVYCNGCTGKVITFVDKIKNGKADPDKVL